MGERKRELKKINQLNLSKGEKNKNFSPFCFVFQKIILYLHKQFNTRIMNKLFYYVGDGRKIIVFKDEKVLAELDCQKTFLTDQEEIQGWLDMDGDQTDYEMIKLEFSIEDDNIFINPELSDKVKFSFDSDERITARVSIFGMDLGSVSIYDDSDVYYEIDEENGIVTDADFIRYNYILINYTVTYLDRIEEIEKEEN